MGDFQRVFTKKLMKKMPSPPGGSGASSLVVLFINALGYCPPGTPASFLFHFYWLVIAPRFGKKKRPLEIGRQARPKDELMLFCLHALAKITVNIFRTEGSRWLSDRRYCALSPTDAAACD